MFSDEQGAEAFSFQAGIQDTREVYTQNTIGGARQWSRVRAEGGRGQTASGHAASTAVAHLPYARSRGPFLHLSAKVQDAATVQGRLDA